jgi:hypothetical protein
VRQGASKGRAPRLGESMVRPIYGCGQGVLLSLLSTSVLRIWDAKPISLTDGEWQSRSVKSTAPRGEGVAVADETSGRGLLVATY